MENKRYFILTPGRSGSSLLGRILADCGAEFPGDTPESWDPLGGAFESSELGRTTLLFAQAHRLYAEKLYTPGFRLFYKKLVTYKRYKGKKRLAGLLNSYSFFKETANLHFTVRPAADLGYRPVIIVNNRDFQTWLGSLYPGARAHSIESLTEYYVSVLKNSLALLTLFGGCVIGYETLTDRDSSQWPEMLGEITGIEPARLLAARNQRLNDPGSETALSAWSAQAERLHDMLKQFEGRIVPTGAAALKRWFSEP